MNRKKENDKLLKTLGQNIKTCRLMKGLTQVGLSDISGIEKSTLSRIEAGKVNISIITLNRLSNSLEIRMKDFMKK